MVAFLSGHLSIFDTFLVCGDLFLERSSVIEPAGIFPVADFNRIIIEAYKIIFYENNTFLSRNLELVKL